MKFTHIVPTIFYVDIRLGLKMFVSCLDFKIIYEEAQPDFPFCVIEKDNVRIHLFQNPEYAVNEFPEFRIITSAIQDVYQKVCMSFPSLLHPDSDKVILRPWGAQEFAIKDEQVCIIFQQWQ